MSSNQNQCAGFKFAVLQMFDYHICFHLTVKLLTGSTIMVNYHFIPVGNYLIFYHVDESKKIVCIDRLLYSARNIKAVL